jgi:hypothetical protein
MGLFSGTKDWNVVAILHEKKGHFQVNGNRAKGPNAEKVREVAKRHSRTVFWAVFNQKRRCSTSKNRSSKRRAFPRC